MGKIYYKHSTPQTITFFFVNQDTRNVEGMIREYRTKNMLSIIRVQQTDTWNDVDNNENAKILIKSSEQISKEEYQTVEFIFKAMVESEYWYLSEDKIEQKEEKTEELVTETVFC